MKSTIIIVGSKETNNILIDCFKEDIPLKSKNNPFGGKSLEYKTNKECRELLNKAFMLLLNNPNIDAGKISYDKNKYLVYDKSGAMIF